MIQVMDPPLRRYVIDRPMKTAPRGGLTDEEAEEVRQEIIRRTRVRGTSEAVALELGVTAALLSFIRSGKRRPTLTLARALGWEVKRPIKRQAILMTWPDPKDRGRQCLKLECGHVVSRRKDGGKHWAICGQCES
jgi:hypothetical protein